MLAAYDAVDCASPVWRPSTRSVAYGQIGQQGVEGIFIKQMDEGEPVQVWAPDGESNAYPLSFNADGTALAITTLDSQGARIVLVDLTGELPSSGETLVAEADSGDFSRDGKWFAFSSSSSGQFQVFVRRFENGRLSGPTIPISGPGGRAPRWGQEREDGKLELTFWNANTSYSTVLDVRGSELQVARPELTVDSSLTDRIEAADVLPDGRLLAVVFGPEEVVTPRIAVVTNALD